MSLVAFHEQHNIICGHVCLILVGGNRVIWFVLNQGRAVLAKGLSVGAGLWSGPAHEKLSRWPGPFWPSSVAIERRAAADAVSCP